jgi:hypothetical protein
LIAPFVAAMLVSSLAPQGGRNRDPPRRNRRPAGRS